jgi:serine/threonine protein phosphatase 1
MSKPLIVIGDIHGAAKTLFALVTRYPDHTPILLGDLVDRGPDSRSVVEWVMKNRVQCVMGNHEHLLVDHYTSGMEYIPGTWKQNGGTKTIKSWHGRVPREVVMWMKALPLHIIPPEYPDLLISHTGHGLITSESQHSIQDALWCRDYSYPKDGLYRILGHNKEKEPRVTETFAMIDTGAAYPGYGKLTAMLWPSREVVQQDYCD